MVLPDPNVSALEKNLQISREFIILTLKTFSSSFEKTGSKTIGLKFSTH